MILLAKLSVLGIYHLGEKHPLLKYGIQPKAFQRLKSFLLEEMCTIDSYYKSKYIIHYSSCVITGMFSLLH